jgi:hypothetical protein
MAVFVLGAVPPDPFAPVGRVCVPTVSFGREVPFKR